MRDIVRTIVVVLTLMLSCAAAEPDAPPPGSIKLLPGYRHRKEQGVDTKIGTIWNKKLTIEYDIGELAGDYTNCDWCGWTKGELWRVEQVVNGHSVTCVFTRKRMLIVTFPESHANFYATVRSDKELSEMLLMVLTYQPGSTAEKK